MFGKSPKKQNSYSIDLSNGAIARATVWRIEAPPECLLLAGRQSCESYAQNLPHPQFSGLTPAPPDAANGTKSLKSRSFIERSTRFSVDGQNNEFHFRADDGCFGSGILVRPGQCFQHSHCADTGSHLIAGRAGCVQ
jgi:hypothetical protein